MFVKKLFACVFQHWYNNNNLEKEKGYTFVRLVATRDAVFTFRRSLERSMHVNRDAKASLCFYRLDKLFIKKRELYFDKTQTSDREQKLHDQETEKQPSNTLHLKKLAMSGK